jgi:hypothetical protein
MASSYDASSGACPTWCARRHSEVADEDDLVHIGDNMFVRNTMIRLCMTIDPETGMQDGPYVLIGSDEFTLVEASTLVDVLNDLLAQSAAPRVAD